MRLRKSFCIFRPLLGLLLLMSWGLAQADSREKIDSGSQVALQHLQEHVPGVEKLLNKAHGVLVFPDVVKMGFGVGGQFGEGSLLVDGEPVAYYATAGSRFGLEDGHSRKSEVVLFMTKQALQDFRGSQGWQVGVNGTVAMLSDKVDGRLNSRDIRDPIVAFVFSDKSLLPGLTLDGSKMNRVAR